MSVVTVQDLQAGPQRQLAQTSLPGPKQATVVFYGGGRGGGKSFAAIYDSAKYFDVADYGCVIFRRTSPELRGTGSIWEDTQAVYPHLGGDPVETKLLWRFPSGAQIQLSHLQHESDIHKWQGRNLARIVFDEAQHFCLTPDHEVLSGRGWVGIPTLKPGDTVYAIVGDRAEYRPVLELAEFDYDGHLIAVEQSHGISLRATPNHRVLVQRQDEQESLGFVEAKRLLETIQSVPRARAIVRQDLREPVVFEAPTGQGLGPNQNSAGQCDMDVWLEFLGWYLSEGCCYDGRVILTQTKPAPELAAMVAKLPWRCCPIAGTTGWNIYSRQLHDFLEPMGDAHQKRVPRWIPERCSARQIGIFLDAFVLGDGHLVDPGIAIGLCNKGLVDDLQELYSLIGRTATSASGLDSTGNYEVHSLHVSSPSRTITMVKPESVSGVPYTGKVYCPIVDCPPIRDFTRGGYARPDQPGGNFLVRHNGRCHFTGNSASQFWFLLSCLRSKCQVFKQFVLTFNPDPDSWLMDFVSPYLDTNGFPIRQMSGVVRWFGRRKGKLETFASMQEGEQAGVDGLKSYTYIPALIWDNPALLRKDPEYLDTLKALPPVQRAQFLDGCWLASKGAGDLFQSSWFPVLLHGTLARRSAGQPDDREIVRWVMCGDLAATAVAGDLVPGCPVDRQTVGGRDPDWTRLLLLGQFRDGRIVVWDMQSFRDVPGAIEWAIVQLARRAPRGTTVVLTQDPGQQGVHQMESYRKALRGIARFESTRPLNPIYMATYASRVVFKGLVYIRDPDIAPWTQHFFRELEGFSSDGRSATRHDDIVSALGTGLVYLASKPSPRVDAALPSLDGEMSRENNLHRNPTYRLM